ncbi:MAG: phosphoribosylglycinamide formyltransferase [Gemmatimonadota bacterium]|nr:phosphoribosylglycinamide formyltransferase [Gemmatimonadota bacterium]MDH3368053.1 phosphoribosylglycinamide formyltransferase [Gemmatimonadota bacterium]MDH3479582.1 phosphoribosylglycinamide formyltransferase [Gemmatimonadota bacterium]
MHVGVLASGGGTNLQALLDRCRGDAAARIVVVISNKPDAGALDRAERVGVRTAVLADHTNATELLGVLQTHGVDLVVLAGYLKLVPRAVVEAYANRMINIHPALLPSFGGQGMYGRRVHEAVLASGATISGPTVHLVTAEYDRGPILAQWPVPVVPDDTPDTLAARVLAIEHQLLPAVVLAAAQAGRAVPLAAADHHFDTHHGPAEVADHLQPVGDR